MSGTARSGRTEAAIAWRLEATDGGTLVTLRADVLHAGALDRALLALGGRAWMRRRFATTLQRLG